MTPEQQKLHNQIGNVIGTEKHDLFNQLKAGVSLGVAVDQFLFTVSYRLKEIVENLKSEKVSD